MFVVFGKGKSGKGAVELLKRKGIRHFWVDDRTLFWEEKLRRAKRVVVSPGIPPRHKAFKLSNFWKKELLGETELAYRFWKGSIVAITGTDGKSTTTRLTYLVLSSSLPSVYEGGNIGRPFSEIVSKTDFGIAVLEVSSFQGYTTRFFRPSVGVFLNFSPDHLDWHSSVEDYLEGKYRIFRNQKKDDLLILNGSDERVLRTPSPARRILFNHPKGEITFSSDLWVLYKGRKLFDGKRLKVKGKHNLINAAVSAVIGLEFGVPLKVVREVLYSFEGLPYRLQYRGTFKGAEFYNDSKSTTPNALKSALESLKPPIVLIFGGKDKGLDYSFLKPLLKSRVELVLAFGENAEKLKETFSDVVEVKTFKNLEEVFSFLRRIPLEGRRVLFSPASASFDQYASYEERGRHFDQLLREFFASGRGGGT